MRIVIDIGHPAHVHFFKHFIWRMQEKGHEFFISVVEKDIALTLLKNYGLPHTNLGEYGRSLAGKVVKIPQLDFKMYQAVKDFNPDLFLGLASIRAAHIAWVMRKKCIIFDDTEIGAGERLLYMPFTDFVMTPACYLLDIGKKQVRYPGYHELAYLHPDRFTPDPEVVERMGITPNDPFVVMRFTGWEATHDIGHKGLTMESKRQAVTEFSRYARVFITSERQLPAEFEVYRITVSPEKIHHVLAYATLMYGESPTMTTESTVLGTPAILIHDSHDVMGNFVELDRSYGCLFRFKESLEDQRKSIEKGVEILTTPDVKTLWTKKRAKLLQEKIDVTAWMMDFVERLF